MRKQIMVTNSELFYDFGDYRGKQINKFYCNIPFFKYAGVLSAIEQINEPNSNKGRADYWRWTGIEIKGVLCK